MSATGTGKETSEAIVSLLRGVVAKYFKQENAALSRNLIQFEIVPNASSFVQSYRLLEGGRGSAVSLSANVDLDVIRALFQFTPAQLGEDGGAKALLVVKGAKLPDFVEAARPGAAPPNPYQVLEAGARDRLSRRGFEVVDLPAEELGSMGPGEDVASPEFLRGLGAKSAARIAVGISSRNETIENENSHNREQRVVVSLTILDVKNGTILGRAVGNVLEPRSRRDQYVSDLQRSLAEEGRDLFHEAFVSAGKKLVRFQTKEEFSVVRVQNPPSAVVVAKFRGMLEGMRGAQSALEYSISRGSMDFAVRPPMAKDALMKAIKAMPSDELIVSVIDSPVADGAQRAPDLVVSLAPKEPAASGSGEGETNAP